MAKEIGWFKETQKPLRCRPGVYRTRFKGWCNGFSFFNGKKWGCQRSTPKHALVVWRAEGSLSAVQDKEWRGLAERAQ